MLAKIGEQLAVSIELLVKPDAVFGVEGYLVLLDHLLRVCHGPSVPLCPYAVIDTHRRVQATGTCRLSPGTRLLRTVGNAQTT